MGVKYSLGGGVVDCCITGGVTICRTVDGSGGGGGVLIRDVLARKYGGSGAVSGDVVSCRLFDPFIMKLVDDDDGGGGVGARLPC